MFLFSLKVHLFLMRIKEIKTFVWVSKIYCGPQALCLMDKLALPVFQRVPQEKQQSLLFPAPTTINPRVSCAIPSKSTAVPTVTDL